MPGVGRSKKRGQQGGEGQRIRRCIATYKYVQRSSESGASIKLKISALNSKAPYHGALLKPLAVFDRCSPDPLCPPINFAFVLLRLVARGLKAPG